MNKKYALHFRLFNRHPFDEPTDAIRLVELVADFAPELSPSHFGGNEPIRAPFSTARRSEAAELLWRTGFDLLLKRNQPAWLAYIHWSRGKKNPWFWTFDFGKPWLEPARVQLLTRFFERLCEAFAILHAVGGLTTDWLQKHEVTDPANGKSKGSAGASLHSGQGLPGIYWFTYFDQSLADFWGEAKWSAVSERCAVLKLRNGTRIQPYQVPDGETFSWRVEQEDHVKRILGESHFFDQWKAGGARPRRRPPVPNFNR